MTEHELMLSIEQARAGGGEAVDTEFKDRWWNFDVPKSKAEFRKDIAGLANAHVHHDGPRHIVVGLAPDGGLRAAPLPCDEARIQETLKTIQPRPRFRIERHEVEGTVLSVIVLDPPFDRPYVTYEDGDKQIVHIRRGSAIGTASRTDFDAFYSEKRRTPRVAVGWEIDGSEDDSPAVLVQPPAVGPRQEVLQELARGVESVQPHLQGTERKGRMRRACEEYVQHCEAFRRALDSEEAFREWYVAAHGETAGRSVRLRLVNEGVAAATSIRLVLEPPEWLYVSDQPFVADADREFGDVVMVLPDVPDLAKLEAEDLRHKQLLAEVERRAEDARRHLDRFAAAMQPSPAQVAAMEHIRALSDFAPRDFPDVARAMPTFFNPEPPPRFDDEYVGVEPSVLELQDGVVEWHLDELLQDHEEEAPLALYILALPGAPVGEQVIEGTIFHRELDRRRPISLKLRVA